MEDKLIIERLRDFLLNERNGGKNLFSYHLKSFQSDRINDFRIKIGINEHREIILEEYDRIARRSSSQHRAFAHAKLLIRKLDEYNNIRAGLDY